MGNFFIVVLFAQIVIQTAVGLLIVVAPKAALPEAAMSEIYLLINQGFIALAMAVVSVVLWVQRKNPAVVGFGVALFAIYHSMVSLSGLFTTAMGNNFDPFWIHVVLGGCFWILWAKRNRLVF